MDELIGQLRAVTASAHNHAVELRAALADRIATERTALMADVLRILDDENLNDDIKRERICALVERPPSWVKAYVQPSEFDAWTRDSRNLLTLHHSQKFPFTQAVLVLL